MARLGAKPPALTVVSREVAEHLDRLSKAALIDLYIHKLAVNLGACDDAPTLEQVAEDANPVLRLRGDRLIRRRHRHPDEDIPWETT